MIRLTVTLLFSLLCLSPTYGQYGLTDVKLTAEGSAQWHVYVDSTKQPGYHLAEREALERSLKLKESNPNSKVWYKPTYRVNVEATRGRFSESASSIWGGYSPSHLFRDPSVTISHDSVNTWEALITAYSEADSIHVISRCVGTDTLYQRKFGFKPESDSIYVQTRELCNQISAYYFHLITPDSTTVATYYIDIWAIRNNFR